MTTTITSQDLQEKFQAVFGEKADHTFFSPGRINLIGEHTDYNGGHVFPAAITLSLIHISEPTRLGMISYAVFCLKKKNYKKKK